MRQILQLGGRLCMIMMDIDKFKDFNDLYGHMAGDSCLTQVAAGMMQGLQRKSDLLYRYGGEEFAVLLSDIYLQDAAALAERICQSVRNLKICHEHSPRGFVTISAGVALLKDEEARDLINPTAELIRRADSALYAAKNAGRDRVMVLRGTTIEPQNQA